MAYSQFPIEEAEVRRLTLDLRNYRFPVDQPTEHAAMNYLFSESDSMAVARLILRDGYVDNELPLVVQEFGRLTILEGNRRLSALRALLDPSLVPAYELELQRLLRRYPLEAANLPQRIRVMRFPDRAAAAPVLARLHIGESKRAWSLDEQAKFVLAQLNGGASAQGLKEQFPAIKDVPRLIRMGHVREMLRSVPFKDRELAEYARSDKLAMSSFEYAYRNPAIQSAIGLTFGDAGSISERPTTSEEVFALERLLRGFLSGDLSTRKGLKRGSPEFDALLREMRPRASSAETTDDTTASRQTVDDDMASDASAIERESSSTQWSASPDEPAQGGQANHDTGPRSAPPADSPRRGPNDPGTKTRLDFSGIDEEPLPLPLKHRVRELRRIDVFEFPAAAVMLMRSVIEAAIKEHYDTKTGPAATGMLSEVMVRVTADYGHNGPLANAISTINRTSRRASATPGTGEWFNLVTHSVNVDVQGAQVHDAWRVVQPLVRFLLRVP
ncbi:MAG: hypothetical protein R3B59_05315 [Dehalococcoidia bacterium]